MRRNAAGLMASTAALALAGCAAPATPAPPEGAALSQPVSTEGFSGPYAAEFARHSAQAPSDKLRQMLSDSVVSDAEFAEVLSDFTRCVADFGYEIRDYRFDGSYGLSFAPGEDPGVAHRRVGECSISSGEADVGSLYIWTRRNPERRDEAEIVAACLVERGVVPPGFSSADYRSAEGTGSVPLAADTPQARAALDECRIDPLGLSG